jgi:hypothetical protein
MERPRLRRVRWRLRGAWMWPTFSVLTLAEGFLIHELPLAGDNTRVIEGMLLAGFFNLAAVGAGAPLLGRLERRRRPDLPKLIAADRAGTALLLLVLAILATVGLIHRPDVQARRRDARDQLAAARAYLLRAAPASYRRNVDRADSIRLEEDRYRTCVPGTDPKRDLCVLVNTAQRPPGVSLDPSREPNASFARGAGVPGS